MTLWAMPSIRNFHPIQNCMDVIPVSIRCLLSADFTFHRFRYTLVYKLFMVKQGVRNAGFTICVNRESNFPVAADFLSGEDEDLSSKSGKVTEVLNATCEFCMQ